MSSDRHLGLGILRPATAVGIPIIALGGINPVLVKAVMDKGVDGIAVMGGIYMEDQIEKNIIAYLGEL